MRGGAPSAPLSLRLRGVRKRYGARVALAGVDLALDGPQVVGVIGPDGAGKTTLLRAVAGLLEIGAEEARVLGFDLRGDVRELKRRIGYVPQAFGLQRDLSVIENLRFTARLHRLSEDELQRRAGPVLERTGLAPFTARAAGALSGGMKQKLAITNALLPDPALLVLDEPSAGVDVLARDEIWELLRERAAHTLVLVSTSYLEEAGACDRLLYLDAGRVVATGTPAELRARVPLELYRVYDDDPRALARAARALPFVATARAAGRSARIEVPRDRSPGAARVVSALGALAGGDALVERAEIDMESTLLWLARLGSPAPADAGASA